MLTGVTPDLRTEGLGENDDLTEGVTSLLCGPAWNLSPRTRSISDLPNAQNHSAFEFFTPGIITLADIDKPSVRAEWYVNCA
jgi:hypothetical protein